MQTPALIRLLLASLFFLPAPVALAQQVRKLEAVQPFYLLGDPVPVCYTMGSEEGGGYIAMDEVGLPGLTLRVFNEEGVELKSTPPFAPEITAIAMDSQLYLIQPRDAVRFCYDLQERFSFSKPGKYIVKLAIGSNVFDQAEINLLPLTLINTVNLLRTCAWRSSLKDVTQRDYLSKAECQVVTGKTTYEGKELWFASVQGLKLGEVAAWNPPRQSLRVPRFTTIEKAELDFKWQVWVVLKSAERRALIVWNLLHGTVQTVVPWGSDAIHLGATAVTQITPDEYIVIAGVPGKLKQSTLSLGIK